MKAKYLTPAQREAIRTLLENAVSDRIAEMEARIPTLALAVSVSPLLGLFGTVWGVMVAFCGVAKAGTADIAALAPGVAGALLTTVAGLVVAIPSLIAYNFLTNGIRKDTVVLDNFIEEFMACIALEQLELEPENTPEPTFSNTLPPRQRNGTHRSGNYTASYPAAGPGKSTENTKSKSAFSRTPPATAASGDF